MKSDLVNYWIFMMGRDRYLSITPGSSTWRIKAKPGDTLAYVKSCAGANCPASARNRYSEEDNVKSWMYRNKGVWHDDPDFTVTCSNHSGLAN